MRKNRLWAREELLLALNLYYKIPFGQFHQRNPKVIELARLIGRTPGSVAMQLGSFASLDPYHQGRGVKGLNPPGKLAQGLWEDAQHDWDNVILESEEILAALSQPGGEVETEMVDAEKPARLPPIGGYDGPTETDRSVKVRLGQRVFREIVVAIYRESCCVCGMPIPELLIASHIIPWKDREDLRLNPSNGLCMCALHDKAFDRGFLTIDDGYNVLISPAVERYMPHRTIENGFIAYHNRRILLPDRFPPAKEFLEVHREEYFVK